MTISIIQEINMSRGKSISLEEARQAKRLNQFAKEHPSEADKARFEAVLSAMCQSQKADDQTSGEAASED